jgi:hypothetical protein
VSSGLRHESVDVPVHDVVPFGLVLAAHVLQNTDVAALDNRLIGDVGAVDDLCEVGAWIRGDPRIRPIRCAGEENGCVLCASWYEDERVELAFRMRSARCAAATDWADAAALQDAARRAVIMTR